MSPHIPHTNFFVFSSPQKKKLVLPPPNPHASLYIPTYPYTSPSSFFACKWAEICNLHRNSLHKMSTCSPPHKNFSQWYPSPHEMLSFRGSVRQGCIGIMLDLFFPISSKNGPTIAFCTSKWIINYSSIHQGSCWIYSCPIPPPALPPSYLVWQISGISSTSGWVVILSDKHQGSC